MTNEEFISFIRKNPISIGCGVLSLALAGASYWRNGQVPESEAELTQKSADGERYSANLKNANLLKEQLEAIVLANKAIDARIIRASQLGNNLKYFYQLESATGVKLTTDPRQSQPLAKKDPKAAFIFVPYAVSVQGDLAQLLSFIRRLENGTHFCRILTINLGAAADRNAPLNVSITLELLGQP